MKQNESRQGATETVVLDAPDSVYQFDRLAQCIAPLGGSHATTRKTGLCFLIKNHRPELDLLVKRNPLDFESAQLIVKRDLQVPERNAATRLRFADHVQDALVQFTPRACHLHPANRCVTPHTKRRDQCRSRFPALLQQPGRKISQFLKQRRQNIHCVQHIGFHALCTY
ncbi:hypothetical protein [Paraburkholderia bannensis]|uniref:hypothetical protein n=1 Tax=Paraburkholderia bannensis TaxID=765414 RepID=UPI002AB732E2|nr:hypothetical protein [Paraburkholderia bannensis]